MTSEISTNTLRSQLDVFSPDLDLEKLKDENTSKAQPWPCKMKCRLLAKQISENLKPVRSNNVIVNGDNNVVNSNIVINGKKMIEQIESAMDCFVACIEDRSEKRNFNIEKVFTHLDPLNFEDTTLPIDTPVTIHHFAVSGIKRISSEGGREEENSLDREFSTDKMGCTVTPIEQQAKGKKVIEKTPSIIACCIDERDRNLESSELITKNSSTNFCFAGTLNP